MGSTNLAIPAIATNQASPEITANAAINALDKAGNSNQAFATADADVTITATQFVSAVFLSFTDAMTALRTVILPQVNADATTLRRLFIAENFTTGGFGLTFTTASSPAGADVTLLASDGPCLLYSTGSDVILVGKLVGTTAGTVAAGDDSRITGAQTVANLNVTYPSIVAAPAHFNDAGATGSFAFGTDGGSPPVAAFFACVSTNNWLRITVAGTFSNSF